MMFNRISNCYNIDDLRIAAKKTIPQALFEYIDGFAEDGFCGAHNRSAFSQYQFVPKMLVDVTRVDTSTIVAGQQLTSPIILAPTALSRLFHHQGERAVASAAGKADMIYTLSTLSSVSIEDVARFTGPKWFQVYVYKDKGLVKDMIQRAQYRGYKALCLTVDAAVPGNREKDLRNGLTIPPRPSLKTAVEAVRHPSWCWNLVTSPMVTTANVSGDRVAGKTSTTSLLKYTSEQLSPSVTWDDVQQIRSQWQGPLIIKGLLSAEDARQALAVGANAIVLSNHGGRQLDHAVSSLEMLPEVLDAVGDSLDVIIDGGIRRGTDVVKALALGAKACMIGRPYLYGLSAGGEKGVSRALQLLQQELERTLQLLGCCSLSELRADNLRFNGKKSAVL